MRQRAAVADRRRRSRRRKARDHVAQTAERSTTRGAPQSRPRWSHAPNQPTAKVIPAHVGNDRLRAIAVASMMADGQEQQVQDHDERRAAKIDRRTSGATAALPSRKSRPIPGRDVEFQRLVRQLFSTLTMDELGNL